MCRYLDINIVRHLKIQITVLNLLIVYDFFPNVTVYKIDKMMFFKTHLYFGTCENQKTTAFWIRSLYIYIYIYANIYYTICLYIYIYKYIVYLFTCNKCLKHYSRKFVRGENCTQRHLHEHFQLPGHTGFLQDIYVTLIDKTNPRILTKHENYWIHTIRTKSAMWLNV